ncbi:MAG: glycosyltransferase [Candidatus Eisenbacteria bacterium]
MTNRPDPSPAPELSVVLPVYNERGSLEQLLAELRAVLPRFVGEWEVVLVNDGSTDGSAEFLDQAKAEDPRLRVLHLREIAGIRGDGRRLPRARRWW